MAYPGSKLIRNYLVGAASLALSAVIISSPSVSAEEIISVNEGQDSVLVVNENYEPQYTVMADQQVEATVESPLEDLTVVDQEVNDEDDITKDLEINDEGSTKDEYIEPDDGEVNIAEVIEPKESLEVPTVKVESEDSEASEPNIIIQEKEIIYVEDSVKFQPDESLSFGEEKTIKEGITGMIIDGVLVKEPVSPIVGIGNKLVEVKEIDYQTEYIYNPRLEYGNRNVLQKGRKGKESQEYIFGVHIDIGLTEPISFETKIVEEAIDEVVELGTKKNYSGSITFWNPLYNK